jgi:cell division protein FtsQ
MWDDAKQLDGVAKGLAVLGVALLLWGALAWAARQAPFAFREVVVRGPLGQVNTAHLEAVVREELAGTFFTMNLEGARASLAKVPWVRSIALRRQWPRRLEVTVEEQVPIARWGDHGLVNTFGEVFAADFNGELPQFAGPEGRAAEVADRFRESTGALAPLGLTVQAVRLSARGGWLVTATGASGALVIELGREDPGARLARFVSVYERTIGALARAGTRIEHVDLRYRNGFAARVPGFRERAPKKRAGEAAAGGGLVKRW